MGERRARWGYGYQDKVATERILEFLRRDLRGGTVLEGVRFADLEAGRVDDFVLVWRESIEGNSIKWSTGPTRLTWGDFIGAAGLLRDLGAGWQRLRARWTGRRIKVRLHTNRPASGEEHHAQLIPSLSLQEFIEKHWEVGPDTADSGDASRAWRKVSEHMGMSGSELTDFVSNCELALGQAEPPGTGPDSLDGSHYHNQFDSLHKAIATWLTNNPNGDFIGRDYLLAAIGLYSSDSRLIQRFPEPDIPYEKNHAAAGSLRTLVDATSGGYLAVVGPAGVGKSTLVQDVLTDSAYPLFVPYYAFLPARGGNRDRAEALTFYQDVVACLDRFHSGRHSLGVANIAHGRDALRGHMRCANERYVLHGDKTILLIDGLDHAMREVNVQMPVLHELPPPSEVPDGFLIILSGQPQAFRPGAIPPIVAAGVAQHDRRVEVSGLSREEVHTLALRLTKPTTGGERDVLYDASRGNPLILTYLLSLFERRIDTSVTTAVELAGRYDGQMDAYYRERLAVPLQDADTRELLGLLCRAARTLPTAWIAEWPEKAAIENIYQEMLAPFVREDAGLVTFIHDSLIAFLKSETRSPLPGRDPAKEERRFHSILADRARGRSCLDPVGRARVVHLMRAERYTEVVEQLSSDWLRSAVGGFLPYSHINQLLQFGQIAASANDDWGETLRLILLDHELDQRTSRVNGADLSRALMELDDIELAVETIRSEGRLLVTDDVALRFTGSLWRYAHGRNRSDLKAVARSIFLQAKPISLIYGGAPIDTVGHVEQLESLRAWTDVGALFEPLSAMVEQLRCLILSSGDGRQQSQRATVRGDLLFRALDGALAANTDVKECQVVIEEIQRLGSKELGFAALLRQAEAAPSTVSTETLLAAYREAETTDDVDLAYAWFLNTQGEAAGARQIVRRIPHIRFQSDRRHSWGFSDVTYTVRLRWLQEMLGIPEGGVPTATDDIQETYVRAEVTARYIGELRALASCGAGVEDRHALFRQLVLFHNRSVHFERVRLSHTFMLERWRGAIYEEIGALAKAMGCRELEALRDVVVDLVRGPAGPQFSPRHRRYFAQLFHSEGVMARQQAIDLGLSSNTDATDEDPTQRQEACLESAAFLCRLGEKSRSEMWKRRASEVAAGPGSHKDYHMAHLAQWLTRSITQVDAPRLEVLDRFARAVEVAGGDGGSVGATTVLRLLVRLAPARAWRLAVEQLDREVLMAWQVVEALIAGGVDAGAEPELLSAMYGELQVMLAPGDTSETATAVLGAFGRGRKRDVARRLISYVRSNALPSQRVSVARALEDAIRKEGMEAPSLTVGLQRGRDDSSQPHILYRLNTGDVETLGAIANRLSNPDRPDRWNPNPEGNPEFDWWAAIQEANIKDEEHFNTLISTFPPPDYREVEALVRKAEVLAHSGDHNSARATIEEAITRSDDGSWHRWLDSARRVTVFRALKQLDHAEGVDRAREQFRKDLNAGRLYSSYLLSDIGEILELLEVDWPGGAVLEAVNDYLSQVLAANTQVRPYEPLCDSASSWSADQALCRFLGELLAVPVVDVGLAARRALARYVAVSGRGLFGLMRGEAWWNPLQLEHLLVAVHVGASGGSPHVDEVREFVESLNEEESLAVRSVAKRICDLQGWAWDDVTTAMEQPVILLVGPTSSGQEVESVLGGDPMIQWPFYQAVFSPLQRRGLDAEELRSEFEALYRNLERQCSWIDDERLQRWVRRLLVRFWLNPGAIVGREAAMRVAGRKSLSGRVAAGAEARYDSFYPIYDPQLEVHEPIERPRELEAMEWKSTANDREDWYHGKGADDWGHYPNSIRDLSLIGERTWYVRPEWEWPRERRYRGLIASSADGEDHDVLKSAFDLTYEMYLDGRGQRDKPLIVLNDERQLGGPVYRWAAINSLFARALGWHPATSVPFRWLDASGKLMVESVYWKDGWVEMEPPRFESLGEGWFVTASAPAIGAIRQIAPEAELHLWVERTSYGSRRWDDKWHLRRQL